jgi:tRNA (uracil-5-)-methyltransferase TRM9
MWRAHFSKPNDVRVIWLNLVEYGYNNPVDPDTAKRLVELNRQFYQTFGRQFSSTRQRLQPGVQRILERLPTQALILDLGCGNGRLWRTLSRRGYRGRYIGLDFSLQMLAEATTQDGSRINASISSVEENSAEEFFTSTSIGGRATFRHADFSVFEWDDGLRPASFDVVLAFAVLHHLPSESLRLQVLHKVRRLLSPDGEFYHSEWQFLKSERLRTRIQDWSRANLTEGQVDPGDFLLDWRQGGQGLRYVHHFDENELADLANKSGFRIAETFLADGEGGQLAIYQRWVIARANEI